MATNLVKHLQEHAILGVTSGGNISLQNTYGIIQGDSGIANASSTLSTIIIQGSNSIATLAANSSPDTLTIDGTNLLPRDGSRAMTANLNMGGFNINNINLVDGIDLSTLSNDHGTLIGLGDDDHTIYLKADGTRILTGNLSVNSLITIDGRDISVDGTTQDSHIANSAIHFTEVSINHNNILNIGTNTHAQIDTHVANSTIHYTVASIDHGSVAGLSDDDHLQYALLLGRSTGQTINGGIAANEDLTLVSTIHGTKGNIFFGNSTYSELNNRLGIGTIVPANTLDISGNTIIGSTFAGTTSLQSDSLIVQGRILAGINSALAHRIYSFAPVTDLTAFQATHLSTSGDGGTWRFHTQAALTTAYSTSFSSDNVGSFMYTNHASRGIGFATGAVTFPTISTTRLWIAATGNVGLGNGTTAPSNMLSVLGAASIGSSTYFSSLAPTNGLLVEGRVSIGANVDRSAQLTIRRPDDAGTVLRLERSASYQYMFRYNAIAGDLLQIGELVSHNPLMTWDGTNERVAIGNIAPTQKLHIYESVNSSLGVLNQNINTGSSASAYFQAASDSTSLTMQAVSATNTTTLAGGAVGDRGVIYSGTNASNGLYIGTHTTAQLVLSTNNIERLRILSGGQIGIGTSVPFSNPLVHIRKGNSTYAGTSHANTVLEIENNNSAYITIRSPNTNSVGILFSDPDAINSGFLDYDHTVDRLYIGTAGTTRGFFGTGLVIGSPTGGDKGPGTLNAVEVYDDNILLTCYVPEYVVTKTINLSKWDKTIPGEVFEHKPARRFLANAEEELDPKSYSNKWMNIGHLPAMPSPTEWEEGGNKLAMGRLIQGLWETVEVQAEHIRKLTNTINDLQQKMEMIQDQIAKLSNIG